ncbi:MAG: hypothetical protein ACLP0J_25945 [Solirubrobacteraceae bacterium]
MSERDREAYDSESQDQRALQSFGEPREFVITLPGPGPGDARPEART